jgi:hypothetical protein
MWHASWKRVCAIAPRCRRRTPERLQHALAVTRTYPKMCHSFPWPRCARVPPTTQRPASPSSRQRGRRNYHSRGMLQRGEASSRKRLRILLRAVLAHLRSALVRIATQPGRARTHCPRSMARLQAGLGRPLALCTCVMAPGPHVLRSEIALLTAYGQAEVQLTPAFRLSARAARQRRGATSLVQFSYAAASAACRHVWRQTWRSSCTS